MGDLPASRVVRPERPFLHCGLDYAGPVRVRLARGRGNRTQSAYIALFVCMAIKAIHVEIVSDYSTETFIAAFHRFCARRGLPKCMYSNCGTNFQGAERELRQAFVSAISDPIFKGHLATDEIDWQFIPPASSHFGGLWEAGVKCLKTHLRKILGSRTPSLEELMTLCIRVEACLNSRPLCPLNDNVDSLEVLTPAHFLIGGKLNAIPSPTVFDTSIARLSRWQSWHHALEAFWRSWANDYVRSLQARTKWKVRTCPISVGQIVLLKSDMLPH